MLPCTKLIKQKMALKCIMIQLHTVGMEGSVILQRNMLFCICIQLLVSVLLAAMMVAVHQDTFVKNEFNKMVMLLCLGNDVNKFEELKNIILQCVEDLPKKRKSSLWLQQQDSCSALFSLVSNFWDDMEVEMVTSQPEQENTSSQ